MRRLYTSSIVILSPARVFHIIIIMEPQPQIHQHTSSFGKFNIFLLIKTAQNSFGLKNGDYSRYRNYCAHKVHKLRQNLGIKYGTKSKFIKKDITNKILQILLFNAEKNWALANETKFSTSRKTSQKSRARFFSVKKYIKALEWAKKLYNVCSEKTDSLSQLESHAYELFLQGCIQFQRQKWAQAQGKLIACRQIMTDITKASDSLSEKVCRQKIDQIEQTIKFCNFKINKGKELTITQIVELRKGGDAALSNLIENLAEKRINDMSLGQGAGEVHFGNERYPIKEEQIIKQKAKIESSILNLNELKNKWLSRMEDQHIYQEVLSFYSDVVLQIEQAVRICDSEREDPKKKQKYTQGELQILKKVSLLFTEIKMNTFIERNGLIFVYSHQMNRGRKSTPQTIAKLLTATITLLQELSEVIKQKGSISNTFQIQHVQLIDAKTFYLRTVRLLFVAQVYFNNSKLKEANGLWSECERCIKILLSKQEMKEHNDKDKFIGSLIPLNQLLQTVRLNKCKCLIANFESQEGKREQVGKKLGEIEISQKMVEQTQSANIVTLQSLISENRGDCQLSLQLISKIAIVELPGKVQPISTRPIFFDLFYQGLQYPLVQSKIKKQQTGKASWWGRLFK